LTQQGLQYILIGFGQGTASRFYMLSQGTVQKDKIMPQISEGSNVLLYDANSKKSFAL
jgi:hypothetical protein